MLANMKKKLSFIILSIISIFIFSSCSGEKEIEIKDLVINRSITVEAKIPPNTEDYILYYHYFAVDDSIRFLSLKYYDNYESSVEFYILQELPNKKLNDIKRWDLTNNRVFLNGNEIDKEHSFKIDDEADYFTSFYIQAQFKYYIVYCTSNTSKKPKEIKFDLILYDASICDEVKPTVMTQDISHYMYDEKIRAGFTSTFNTDCSLDYRLVEFTAAKTGLFRFTYYGSVVDYCTSIPKGFEFNDVICSYYGNLKTQISDGSVKSRVRFYLELEENETVYFRLRRHNFYKFHDSIFKIEYVEFWPSY